MSHTIKFLSRILQNLFYINLIGHSRYLVQRWQGSNSLPIHTITHFHLILYQLFRNQYHPKIRMLLWLIISMVRYIIFRVILLWQIFLVLCNDLYYLKIFTLPVIHFIHISTLYIPFH